MCHFIDSHGKCIVNIENIPFAVTAVSRIFERVFLSLCVTFHHSASLLNSMTESNVSHCAKCSATKQTEYFSIFIPSDVRAFLLSSYFFLSLPNVYVLKLIIHYAVRIDCNLYITRDYTLTRIKSVVNFMCLN